MTPALSRAISNAQRFWADSDRAARNADLLDGAERLQALADAVTYGNLAREAERAVEAAAAEAAALV